MPLRAGWFGIAADGACAVGDGVAQRDVLAGPTEFSDSLAEAVYRTVLQAISSLSPAVELVLFAVLLALPAKWLYSSSVTPTHDA